MFICAFVSISTPPFWSWSTFEGVEAHPVCYISPESFLFAEFVTITAVANNKKNSPSSSFQPSGLWEEHLWSQKGQIGLLILECCFVEFCLDDDEAIFFAADKDDNVVYGDEGADSYDVTSS